MADFIETELIGWKAQPKFRIAEIEGLSTVDVAQTTFPRKWRDLPVYTRHTESAFQIVEKMRGMGLQRPEGLSIVRQLWLDEDGSGFTYRDRFQGKMRQLWRLDVAEGQQLGAVRADGLDTLGPLSRAHLLTRCVSIVGPLGRVRGNHRVWAGLS